MKIGVLSDTHLHDLDCAIELAERLLTGHFKDVAAIVHAGDAVMDDLSSCFYPLPWYAVRGNMDPHSSPYPAQRILDFAGYRVGLIHGWGPPTGLEQRVISSFADQSLDVLIFGHSHRPVCRKIGELLLFNPGSAIERRQAKNHTVGLLEFGETVEAKILVYE